MTPNTEFLAFLQLVAITLLGFVLKWLSSVKDQLARLNNRLAKVEMWQEGHEKLDEQRFGELGDRLDRL